MSKNLLAAAAVVLLTLVGYFVFPGHTYLQSDTQIYVPMLERLWDPTVFANEPLALHPHLAFTIYDEVALALRRLSGLDFRIILTLQQLLFRALGILGVYLLARSLELSMRMALLATSAFSLGATILGPAVLTFEYEPVPRGFAVMLVFFAVGLAAQGKDLAAGVAGSLAFLYHPPTSAAFWIVYAGLTLWPTRPAIMRRHIIGLLPLFPAVVLLFIFSRLQPGVSEPQDFFGRIGGAQEMVQRFRAFYNWISLWDRYWIWQYLFLWGASIGAVLRCGAGPRKTASTRVSRLQAGVPAPHFFLLGLPLVGVAGMPVSYLMLERMKWVVAPQFQFARVLLFVTAMAGIAGAAAGIRAAANRRLPESLAWFALVFAIPISPRLADLFSNGRQLSLVLVLAACATLAAWSEERKLRWSAAAWASAALVPFMLIPSWGQVQNYPRLHTPELAQLVHWAGANTPKEAVFLFPDAGHDLDPGVFRAEALRAVYVDWKAGGQVNFMKQFGEEWWRRWQTAPAIPSTPAGLRAWAQLGIDYVVLKPEHRIPGQMPVYSNDRYVVYATNSTTSTSNSYAIPHPDPVRR